MSKVVKESQHNTADNMNEEEKECPICCYEYNHKLRSRVTCKCGFTICKICARKNVLDNAARPSTCINPDCKIKWSDEFMNKQLNKSFMNKEYKNEKKKKMFEHQQSKFPETILMWKIILH